ncbi:unnamed protein product [Mytilus coruscus]|uniref:Uncharacterized protein n=1 Tax=Mytilus coruscus TaxID=42192 RepID=A0A6J8E5C7_MYTCO|nr:unnamed protein product [Mytilus coruscus]
MEMREQILIPVLKEDCKIPEQLKPFTYIDARGPIGSWLPRLVTAIESSVNCGLESKYSQVDFSTHYRNFDTVHEERSKVGRCRELPFKSRRYIPDSLNDKAFNDYLEQCFQKNNVDTSQRDDERSQNGAIPSGTVYHSDDEAIIPLLENEEITSHIECNRMLSKSFDFDTRISDIARDLLISLSVDFVQDFLEQKLENSESYRHTSRAVCLCEYAEKHGLVQVPINDSDNSERGLRNHSEESTNHFANVV